MSSNGKRPNGRFGPQWADVSIEALSDLLSPGWRDRRPIYDALTSDLRRAVSRGHISPGSRLPAERALANGLAVSRSTVVRAYGVLRDEGWLMSYTGSGSYASHPGSLSAPFGISEMLDAASTPRHVSTEVINLSISRPLPLHDVLARAIATSAHGIARLADNCEYAPQGLPELRALIAERFSRRGLPTSERQILVTAGAQQAISLVARLCVSAGDAVVFESPTYLGAIDVFRERRARLVTITTFGTPTTVEQLHDVLRRVRPALVFLMPTCHTVTGEVTSLAERKALAELSRDLQLPLIDDDIFADLTFEDPPAPPVAAFATEAPIFTIGSTSKLIWNGLRVGWLRAPEAAVTRLVRLRSAVDLGTSLVAQLVARHILVQVDEIAQLRRKEMLTSLQIAERMFARTLPEWRFRSPQGGRSLWIKLPGQHADAGTFIQTAQRHGVTLVPGPALTSDGSHSNYVRVMYVQRPEVLTSGIDRLALAWDDYTATIGDPYSTRTDGLGGLRGARRAGPV